MAMLQKFTLPLSAARHSPASVWMCFLLSLALSKSTAGFAADLVAPATPAASSVAILGDSLAVGAATHPSLVFDGDSLWDVFKGPSLKPSMLASVQPFIKEGRLDPPVSLSPSPREYEGGLEWVFAQMQKRLAMAYLNTGEYSWGYLVSRAMGVPAEQIYLAGDNGAKVASLARQSDRVLDHLNGVLPTKAFVLFTGNDLCAPHVSFMTSSEHYKSSLLNGLKYLVANAKVSPHGSQINLVAFLPITQLLTSEAVLDKKVVAFGEEMTCRDLKKRRFQTANPAQTSSRHPETLYMGHLIPPNPAFYCPSLFSLPVDSDPADETLAVKKADREKPAALDTKSFGVADTNSSAFLRKAEADETLSILASRVRQYRDATRAASLEMADWAKLKYPDKAIQFRYLDQTESLSFSGEDVGPDCFHLSVSGHAKVAEAVLQAFPRL